MKNNVFKAIITIIILASVINCSATKKNKIVKSTHTKTDTIKIVNEEQEYEVIIIDPGFNSWLVGRAKPRNFYSQAFLETKNILFVTEWNIRVNNPNRYAPNLYEMPIDYQANIDYGYEVNYLLFNYFVYFQQAYNQRLIGGRINW